MQRKSIFFLYAAFSIIHANQIATQHTNQELLTLTRPQQDSIRNFEEDTISYFLRPIQFTQEGLAHYFKYTYNHESYTDFLPYNFSHMLQFLQFGQTHDQSEQFAKSVIKLFMQKVKACSYINAYSFLETLAPFASCMQPYFSKKEDSFLEKLTFRLKEKFVDVFSQYFTYFKKNPDAFLEALSQQIAHTSINQQTQHHIDLEQLKKDVLRFLEICINKIVWSPEDGYNAWLCMNHIADQAYMFLDKKIITDIDAYDDICWSLVHRFCYFMHLFHKQLPQTFFYAVLHDITTKKLLVFEVEEQEELMTTKKDFLINSLKKYMPKTSIDNQSIETFSIAMQ